MLMEDYMIENYHVSSATDHTLGGQNIPPGEEELYWQGSSLIEATRREVRSRSFDETKISEVAHSRAHMRHHLSSRNN